MSTPEYVVYKRVSDLTAQLADLRHEFGERHALYEIYSQPLLYELGLLEDRIREDLTANDTKAEVWIALKGRAFGEGRGLAEVVANFLTNLRIAAKHAASALIGEAYSGGRFVREVEDSTSFDLVALAPGSLQLGLSRTEITQAQELPDEGLFNAEAISTIISDASNRDDLGIRAIKTLMLALEASEDEVALAKMRSELDDHNTLRVLYHARALFPRGVESVEFRGRAVGQARMFPSSTRARLEDLGQRLGLTERYVTGIGVVRMLDLDRRTVRFEFASIDLLPDQTTLPGEFSIEIDSGEISEAMNRLVEFTGSLIFDAKGSPQKVKIDTMSELEPAGETDDYDVA